MTSRTAGRRILAGLTASAMGQALAAVQAFVLVPLFVSAWDADVYGRWLALSAIASHLAMADLGGQNFVANLLAMHFGRGEALAFRDRLSEAMSLCVALGAALLALLATGVVWAAGWLPSPLAAPLLSGNEAVALLLLGANAVIFSVPGGVYATVYRATGQFARGMAIGNVTRVANIGGSIVLLAAGATPASIAAWLLATAAAGTAALVIDSRRVIPECRDIRVTPARAAAGVRRLARGSMHFWLIGAAIEVTQQTVVLILAALASPAAVAAYATHRLLATLPGRLTALAQGPVAPELSFLWARRQHADLTDVSLFATTIVMGLSVVVAAALWAVAPAVYGAWTTNSIEFDAALLCVLLVQGIAASGWQTSAWGLMATNQHHALAGWSAARAVVTIVLASLLAPSSGALGVAAAALAADVVCGALVVPAQVASAMGVRAGDLYARLAMGAVPLVPLVVHAFGEWPVALGTAQAGRTAAAALAILLALVLSGPLAMPMLRSLPRRLSC